MRKKKLLPIICLSILSTIALLGCQKQETQEPDVTYDDIVNETIETEEDTYYGGSTTTSGEYSSSIDDTTTTTLDYGNLTNEEIEELLKKQQNSNPSSNPHADKPIELNKAQEMAASSSVKNIADEDLNLFVSYLLLNVFSNDYTVDVDLDAAKIEDKLNISEDMYTAAFVQGSDENITSYFGLFKVNNETNCEALAQHLIDYANSLPGDANLEKSIVAKKSCGKDENGEMNYVVLFISFDLSNREEPLEIPEGYALVEEKEDGTYILETQDMYGNSIQYSGSRITMNMDYRNLITEKLESNNYEILK